MGNEFKFVEYYEIYNKGYGINVQSMTLDLNIKIGYNISKEHRLKIQKYYKKKYEQNRIKMKFKKVGWVIGRTIATCSMNILNIQGNVNSLDYI